MGAEGALSELELTFRGSILLAVKEVLLEKGRQKLPFLVWAHADVGALLAAVGRRLSSRKHAGTKGLGDTGLERARRSPFLARSTLARWRRQVRHGRNLLDVEEAPSIH